MQEAGIIIGFGRKPIFYPHSVELICIFSSHFHQTYSLILAVVGTLVVAYGSSQKVFYRPEYDHAVVQQYYRFFYYG
jgi:hypothetical protein